MKAKDIEIGGVYMAKVSGKIVPVRVLRKREDFTLAQRGCNYRAVWDCRNELTGRLITVKSAQRFRSRVETGAGEVV